MNIRAEVVLPLKSVLGEGALWNHQKNLLYWVDILDHKVFVYNPATGENKTFEVKEYPSTIVPRESGGAVVTLKNGFAALDLKTGACEMLCEVEKEREGNRFNDGKCDPAGRFWAGTMDFNLEPGKGGLYRLDTRLQATKVLGDVSCSNGIVWTQDGNTMYYIDSLTQEVHRFDFDRLTGNVSNRGTAVKIPKDDGLPDGMAIDEEGMIWVALFWGGRVNRYNPLTGEALGGVEVPGANLVTSCAFGGPSLDELYITTASCDYKDQDWEKWPHAGSLFKVKVNTRGVPAQSFKG